MVVQAFYTAGDNRIWHGEEQEEVVVDPDMAWARADYQDMEQTRHSAEQQTAHR